MLYIFGLEKKSICDWQEDKNALDDGCRKIGADLSDKVL